jgi:hypothetical protein
MGWIIFLFLAVVSFMLIEYWAIIPITLVLLGMGLEYLNTFRKKPSYDSSYIADRNIVTSNKTTTQSTDTDEQTQLTGLVLLHLAIKHHSQLGNITTTDYQALSEQIDKMYAEVCGQLEISHSKQQLLLASACTSVNKRMQGAMSEPLWPLIFDFKLDDIQTAPIPATDTPPPEEFPECVEPLHQPPKPVIIPIQIPEPVRVPSETPAPISVSAEIVQPVSVPTEIPESVVSVETPAPVSVETQPPPKPTPQPEPPAKPQRFVWLPRLPSREFITQILMPFLWQNIGWFIGGFCFVSGSVFLVAHTAGFFQALAIFIILNLYALILFLGGYQIRRHRPELLTSSNVLLMLGVLLVPINLTAAVRLIQSGMPHVGWISLAVLLSLIAVGVFMIATSIASGMIERTLQGEHPRLFIGLAALQFAKPLLNIMPHWSLLAGLHISLLGILGYALLRFSRHWLHSIFIDQRKIAYYAAGTLVYAALVSFVLLTWQSGIDLPAGYAGPFLMAGCLLLLSVDIQFKQWINKQALLSHFSFVIYALSVLAVLLSLSGQTFLPPTLSMITLSLILGAVLYGLMLWKYLTLPPLYLLLACLSGLYTLLILQYFPYHWYFLLSLPGFGGITLLQSFAQKRESMSLVLVCYRAMIGLSGGLLGWSLYHASPSIVGMLTALVATGGALWRLKWPPQLSLSSGEAGFFSLEKRVEPYKGYIVTALTTVTLAYVPLSFGIDWIYQFSSGLIILAVLWAALAGWKSFQREATEILFNSSLLSLALSITLAAIYTETFLAWLLFVVGGVLLWLSLSLQTRVLFYAMLVSLGVAGVLLKHYYFPASTGRGVILLALGVWLLLWWFHYRLVYLPAKTLQMKARYPQDSINQKSPLAFLYQRILPDFSLLWWLPVRQETYSSRFKMVKPPLEQAMFLLWVVGLWRILEPLLNSLLIGEIVLNTSWSISAFWGALVTGLLAGYSRRLELLPLAIFLLGSALFVFNSSNTDWLPLLGAGYALFLWLFSVGFLRLPRSWVYFLGWQGGYGAKGGGIKAEQQIHWTVFTLSLLSVGWALFNVGETAILLFTLGTVFWFFLLAGQRYRLQLHSYFLIASACLGGLILYGWLSELSVLYLLEAAQVTLLLTVLAIGLAILAQTFVAYPSWQTLYQQPLYHTSGVIYLWALFNSLLLFFTSWQSGLSVIFVLLSIGLLPLLRPFNWAPAIRGVGIALLLSIAVTDFFWEAALQKGIVPTFIPYALMFWGFILWGASNYGLPRLNARWQQWAITPNFWPWLGFLLVLSGLWLDTLKLELPLWHSLPIVTVYLLLMFRNVKGGWLAWLAGLTLTLSGLSVLFSLFDPVSNREITFFIFSAIIWSNLLLRLGTLSQRYGQTFLINWKINRLAEPLFMWPFILLGVILLLSTMATSPYLKEALWEHLITVGILLNLSFLHFLSLRPQRLPAHIFLLSLLNTLFLVFHVWFNIPLLLSLWTTSLLLFLHFAPKIKTPILKEAREVVISTMRYWIPISFSAALLSVILIPGISLAERLFIITWLAGLSFAFGFLLNQRMSMTRGWLTGSVILLGGVVHVMWLVWLPDASFISLLPWYALQNVLLAEGFFWFRDKTLRSQSETVKNLSWFLKWTSPLLATLAALAWLGHGISFFSTVHLLGILDNFAALLAGILLIRLWWLKHDNTNQDISIYGLSIMVALLGVYIRTFWFGFAPLNVWDTAILMGAGYVLFTIQYFSPSQPLYRLTLLMPILAILTVPFQLNSVSASSTLLVATTLYLLMQRNSKNNLPLYLGLLALNLGIYLWIPGWVANSKLLQLYIIPVAITVLLMLQLHRMELKPRVLSATRLVALSALYASATLDVFMRPELSIFLLAIALSLFGILLGIALRVRTFLYLGTIFLIFNVFGQLIDFYPEDRLGKAIVLMVLGGLITGGMIWFNIQREALMQRVRIVRADLAQWE